VISAVGHETDTTLIDFASDQRAPTPTAAAEMAIPARSDLVADLEHKGSRLTSAVRRSLHEQHLALTRAERGLPDLPGLVGAARQRLDDRAERIVLALPALVERRRAALTLVERRLPDPHRLVAVRRASLDLLAHRLEASALRTVASARSVMERVAARVTDAPLRASLREARAHLAGATARLESASPLAILQRGYVLVTDPVGHPITTAAAVKPHAKLQLHFGDGKVDAVAQAGSTAGSNPARGRRSEAQEKFDL
jgi:exodeoxyribonuclease VII large subunit